MRRNKLYSVLLSLAVAFGLWLYVTNNVSIEDDNTFYNVPVVMEGEAVLNEQNLMVTSVSSSTVSLHLTGARSELSKLDSSKLAAKVDLSQIEEPGEKIALGYTISFPSDVSPSSFTVGNKNPGALFVSVDCDTAVDLSFDEIAVFIFFAHAFGVLFGDSLLIEHVSL